MVDDLIKHTKINIKKLGIKNAQDILENQDRLVKFGDQMKEKEKKLKLFLKKKMYNHLK